MRCGPLLQLHQNRVKRSIRHILRQVWSGGSPHRFPSLPGVPPPMGRLAFPRKPIRPASLGNASHRLPYLMLVFSMVSLAMQTARKITVEIPEELLAKAQKASGTGITQTVRAGLQLIAASRAYARLRQFRGKVRFTRTWAQLKADR